MAQPPQFSAAGGALLRTPALPVAQVAGTRVDLGPDRDGYRERLVEFVRAMLGDPMLREAAAVSSEPLAGALGQVQAGKPVELAKLRRAAHTAARYRLRMAGRPTPFGLLAGVATAAFDTGTKVRFGADHRKGVRPDAGWLTGLVAGWEHDPAVRSRLRVVANDLCIVRGDRLVLPYLPRPGSEDAESVRELSVRLAPPVRAAVELAAAPIAYPDLVARLADAFPGASVAAVENMTGQLIERELLLTDLHPPLTHPDPLGYLVERLRGTDLPQLAVVQRIAARLAEYAEQPLGAGYEAWHAAVGAMRTLRSTDKPPVQVDLRIDADVTLPQTVAAEAARAASVLWRLSPPWSLPPHLRQYHRDFVERYGIDRLVPLLELLDPERGLGAPSGYREPPSDRPLDPGFDVDPRPWDKGLAGLAEQALLDGTGEVVLDDGLVDTLTAGQPDAPPPPDTMELTIQVLAESDTALDAGGFRLVIGPGAGSTSAGSMFGRFAYLFEEGAYRIEPATPRGDHDPLPAQLLFRPVHPRGANVLQVPQACEHLLAVGTFAERVDPRVLGAADVAVGADTRRLYLVSLRHGRELVPVSPHMLNVDYSAGNAVRLIREIGASRRRAHHAWSWGEVGILPRLPRVRYGRTVLAAATWQVGAKLRDRDLPWRQWQRELAAWRERWRVPDRVQAGVIDHRLELDLTAPLHQQLLREELGRRPDTVLQEVVGTEAETGWLNGYANEVVVPLVLTARDAVPRPIHSTASGRRPAYLPGGEWLYAKLYGSSARQDELLGEHVSALVEELPPEVDRWFFIRYADPDPHLRLRFHGPSAVLCGKVLPAIHDWAARLHDAGLAGRMTLDAYEPEVERYGGPAAAAAAERAFAADSDAALGQLRLRHQGLDLPAELLAAANYIDLLRGFGDPDWRDWLLDHPRDEHHRAFQATRRQAVRLIDPVGDWAHLSTTDSGRRLLEAWRRRRPAVAGYGQVVRQLAPRVRETVLASMLHMHHNRLIGIDPAAEARSLAIARGAVRAHLDRARAGS
jgi:thiopeptide-type bacteriocin biosynthesis protein